MVQFVCYTSVHAIEETYNVTFISQENIVFLVWDP